MGMCGWRISGARESCAAATIGTSRSRARIFNPREISLTSCTRLSFRLPPPCMSCR